MRPSGSDQQGDPQMYIATTHRHTHANHRCYNDLHASSTARRHRLVAPRVASHRPLRSVKRDTSCGLIASPLAGTDFATHPHGSLFESVCGVPAKAKKGKMELAELLQRPQRRKWSLQNFCKCPKEENGACRTSASVPKEKMELAELLQMPQRRKWSLQDFCKGPKGENGACRTSANAPKGKMELAELLQTPQRRKRSLQNFCKRLPIHSYITPHT